MNRIVTALTVAMLAIAAGLSSAQDNKIAVPVRNKR
jgi:hypothetical protein